VTTRHRLALASPTSGGGDSKQDKFLRVDFVRHPLTGRKLELGTVLIVGRWPDFADGRPSWYGIAAYRGLKTEVEDMSKPMASRLRIAAIVLIQGVGQGEIRRDEGRLGLHVMRELSADESKMLPDWYSEVSARTEPAGPRRPW
jgi:hypothetical protein